MVLLHCMSPVVCRFSDAGDDDLTTRSGGRRPKSAKARNRGGGWGGGGAAGSGSAKRLWGFGRGTGLPEIWGGCLARTGMQLKRSGTHVAKWRFHVLSHQAFQRLRVSARNMTRATVIGELSRPIIQ